MISLQIRGVGGGSLRSHAFLNQCVAEKLF